MLVSPMITIDPPSSPHTVLPPLSRLSLTRFLSRARSLVDLSGTVSILLTSDVELKRLNRTFRGKNKPTDVLSFPADPILGLPADQQDHQHAGDIAISLDTAARQAQHFGHDLQHELKILILHGLLHLSGLDHETDSGDMAARELDLRTRLRLPSGLIDRTFRSSDRSILKPAAAARGLLSKTSAAPRPAPRAVR